MADYIGQQFGNYRFIRLLGRGGFAEVYLGQHITLNMQAAIKLLHTQLTSNDVERFRNEACTLASLIHPNIVRILDFDVKDYCPFIVMDYAPKGTLRQCHSKGAQLPIGDVVSYVKQIASALQFAHNEKWIHRDIKPDNMLMGQHNEVLLSDFGLAVIARNANSMTTKDIAGTALYMAPEQLQGKPCLATDQYALGVVVYEWLSGECPFHGSSPLVIAAQHINNPPPLLREKVSTISPAVEQVYSKH